MGTRTKTLFTVILVGVVVAGLAISIENKSLFKGQIFGQNEADEDNTIDNTIKEALPDLASELNVINPEVEGDDLVVEATIKNIGDGKIEGGTPFKYTILINDTEVFTNSDTYSELAKGDAFSFKYPIAQTIYNYPREGTVKLIIDSENAIGETDEENNETTKEYKY